jgi:hypothetical protein
MAPLWRALLATGIDQAAVGLLSLPEYIHSCINAPCDHRRDKGLLEDGIGDTTANTLWILGQARCD